MRLQKALNIDDLRKMAKASLPRMVFDYIEGGPEDELGLKRNRDSFEGRHLLPRYLVDVGTCDQSVEIFGRRYDSPFGIAPTGLAGLARPGGDLILARAASAANIPYIMSSASIASLEEAAEAAPRHTWFQLYAARDKAIYSDMIRRVADAGIETLVVTIDTPLMSKRERDLRNGFGRPRPPLSAMLDAVFHPLWAWRYMAAGGMPSFGNWTAYAGSGARAAEVSTFVRTQMPRPLTWNDLAEIRKLWRGNLVVKGVMHPDDAIELKQFGCEGIIVSNHGGRQLDRAAAPMDILEKIVAVVGNDMTVMLDSGVRRGSDILMALCLGARFVFAGRAPLYGLGAAGEQGAVKAIRILREELATNMAQLGCADIRSLGLNCLLANRE